MEYALVGILVLLLVAGFVTFFVLNATNKGGGAAPADPGAEGNPAGIAAPDESPLGDTTQHAGDQREGQTVEDPEHSGGARGQRGNGQAGAGEGGRETATPASERLADRPR
jgi:hypothetical protein